MQKVDYKEQYYCQNPETLLISSRFYWVSDIFRKIGNSIVINNLIELKEDGQTIPEPSTKVGKVAVTI